jgi:hypothetical protein
MKEFSFAARRFSPPPIMHSATNNGFKKFVRPGIGLLYCRAVPVGYSENEDIKHLKPLSSNSVHKPQIQNF